MITKEKAIEIVKQYLKDRNREYLSINESQVNFEENKYVNYGKYYEQKKDMYVVTYYNEGYINPLTYFVSVEAETGEVLFTMSKHGYVEDWEEDESGNLLE